MRRGLIVALLLCIAACHGADEQAAAVAGDGPATRIVALAPHLAELVYAAGAGAQLVGVSAYTNYPAAASSLPVVGDAFRIDQEQLALLRPDLLLVWASGTPAHIVDALRQRGYRLELIRTHTLADIVTALQRIGALTGNLDTAASAAQRLEARLQQLADAWREAAPIRVFYQVSLRPLYTVNGQHYISELISLCGGQNVFADLNELAPMVSEEAVLERNPEVLLAADTGEATAFAHWHHWQELAANRYQNHFVVPADVVARPTDRVHFAGEAICDRLQQGRARRSAGHAR